MESNRECEICCKSIYKKLKPPCGHEMCKQCAWRWVIKHFDIPTGIDLFTFEEIPDEEKPFCPTCRRIFDIMFVIQASEVLYLPSTASMYEEIIEE